MRVEPPTDHAALRECLADAYGLHVASLRFVPEGEGSIAYVVDCTDGSRYFLKLWPDTRRGRMQRAKLDVYLPVTRELYERGIFRNLPYPVPTLAGQLHLSFGDSALALFPYIVGQTLSYASETWPDAVRDQLACAVATIHQTAAVLHSALPAPSPFEMSFATDLTRELGTLESVGSRPRPAQQALRNLLLPQRETILSYLAHTYRLRPIAADKTPPLVFCHADIHAANLLLDAAGRIHILDWEDIAFAPAEHDLQAFTDRQFARFLQVYWQAGGVQQIDIDQFAFYNYRRYLQDLTRLLMRVIYENTDAAQDEYDLAGIQAWCLDKLAVEEDKLTRIAAAIAVAQTLSQPPPPGEA